MFTKKYLNDQIKNGKTWKQIAQENNISYTTLIKIRKKLNMKISPPTTKIAKKELLDLYIKQKQPVKQISKKLKVSTTQIYRLLKKYNINIIDKSPSKQELLDEYNINKLSKSQLATKFGCSIALINKLFKIYNIKARTNSESQLVRSETIRKQMKKQWSDPDYIQKMVGKYDNLHKMNDLAKKQLGKISSIQRILYSILDDLNIEYEIEKTIGYWTFDCYINKHNLLIECQGNYWHSLKNTKIKDSQKASYISNNFPDKKLIYVWEHEFKCRSLVVDLIKYHTNNKTDNVNFSFDDLSIKRIKTNDAELFLSKYHYAGKINKSSHKYGVFCNNNLIAACVFSNPTRSESASRLGYDTSEIMELSRFCIHPHYHKKNFGSWTVSRCKKLIKNDVPRLKCLISFADTTFNHDGTIYKASGWRLDGEVKPSYWYVNEDGYVMHKKTLWDHAKKMSMSENDYAKKYGYQKVYGKKKFRYLFEF